MASRSALPRHDIAVEQFGERRSLDHKEPYVRAIEVRGNAGQLSLLAQGS
ncbi:MAG TPA: hypothetical protein VN445_08595 [Rectinemataceae bacterium]|nr:hypothetical protein [Rectinemataceae bacterium]